MTLRIEVSVADQTLSVLDGDTEVACYPVSTAAAGVGEQEGSGCTPRGAHIIRAKIGSDAPEGAVFVGRRQTGGIYSEALATAHPNRDWILTRILWLSGTQPGFNRLGRVDTMRRYIYIHGTPDSNSLGAADSHGCVRMNNRDLIDLFDRVPVGTPVEIFAPPNAATENAA